MLRVYVIVDYCLASTNVSVEGSHNFLYNAYRYTEISNFQNSDSVLAVSNEPRMSHHVRPSSAAYRS